MKEFISAFRCALIFQLICWSVFILFDENKYISQSSAESLAITSGIIILIILLFIYFIFMDKFIKRNDMNSKIFNAYLFLIWSLLSIAIMFGLFYLIDNKYLHVCQSTGWGCFLNGIEYGLEGFFMISLAILIIIVKFIITIYKYITKNKNYF